MLDAAGEVYAWIEGSATVYVCGDEKRMAPGVDAALRTILQREGGLSPERAEQYLAEMIEQNRYQRDVY